MSSLVTGYLTAGAERLSPPNPGMREEHYQHYVVYSPNPEQDSIYTQGISPRYEFDHSDHILDQPARLQLYPVNGHERAVVPMENWSPSWNPSTPEHWYRTQSQFLHSLQVFEQPENLHLGLSAHAIGSQEPFSDQLIRQQHPVYRQSRPVRSGGRARGTHLPEETANNCQEVREVGGSCLRCWALNEKCARKEHGRKWIGCYRSFSELENSIIPSILGDRLHLGSYESWMRTHTKPLSQKAFTLPLSFGFGKVFNGFLGCEFSPLSEESMYSYEVRSKTGEALRFRGLPILATYKRGGSKDIAGLLKKWLQETLRDEDSMSQWLWACFPGEEDTWITVPAEELDVIINMLQRPQPEYTTNTSRQINKGVKCVLFDIYKKMQRKVLSQLNDIVKNSKTMNDREWGNMYCVSILLIVIINHAQLSLRANYSLAERDQRGEWEETKRQLEESEAAFRTIVHSFAHSFREKKKEINRRLNGNEDPIASRLLHILGQIQLQYTRDVSRYCKEKLGDNMNTQTWFSAVNRLRLFAYSSHAMNSRRS
ncbi:beta-galactosidase [Talaromyces islandicus]|uniref:Beta-galactosidase n=1 Tax=Talaromyces islandicus TaxID=28573 RepID=A0A0U1M3L7_TALIS|nr:beta-galactosidase [Talaromyces islandicus]